jgi:basic membrane protein A
MDDLSGRDIGRYHILEPLGEGGMAKVYKAFDTHLENEVAVKVIRTDQLPPAMLDKIIKRFEREAKEVAKLSHPNIVRVIDYGEQESIPYLVMQYLHGGTMKAMLGKQMPYQKAAALLAPIARALEYAHQHKMVHRDVKPANILITDGGEPMLTDFGIVKMLDVEDGATLTGTGVGLGTPEYMAPEQWVGEFSPAVDQYSLGVVLFELVTGRRPYNADTPAAVLLKQASDPLPRPSDFVKDLPESAEHVILKALAKNPKDRYESMGELANALTRLERGTPDIDQQTMMAGIPAVAFPPKIQPAEETRMEVVPSKPAEKQPLGTLAGLPPAPPASVKEKPMKGNKKSPLIFILSGTGLLVVALAVIGIVSGWFTPQVSVTPSEIPTNLDKTTFQPTIIPTLEVTQAGVLTTKAPTLPSVAQKSLKVCMVTDTGGINDKSFNQTTWQGIEIAKAKLNIEGRYIESVSTADYEKNINAFVNSGCDVIVGVGFQLADAITAAAKANPKIMFTGVDFTFNPVLPNAVGQQYQTDQAAFLAGYLAAGMSKTGKVATYGGMSLPTVNIFMDGFSRGVAYYNQVHQTKVQAIGWNPSTQSGLWADTFYDTNKGVELAKQLIDQGADVIFPVAGPVGIGTAQTIQDLGGNIWFIGVDSDWTQTQHQYSKFILTSVLKAMDVSTYTIIESIYFGQFKPGTFAGTMMNGGVSIATPNSAVPSALLQELEQVKADIIAGKITFNPAYKIK